MKSKKVNDFFQHRERVIIIALISVVIGLLVLLGFKIMVSDKSEEENTVFSELVLSSSSHQQSSDSTPPVKAFVDVKGAVHQPGMYEITDNMRLQEIINQAGGFTDEADENQVNLAQVVTDQMVIYVPKKGEEVSPSEPVVQTNTVSEDSGKVNINTADAAELQQLNGIGQKKAEAIIQHRETNGSFQKVEDLMNVKGVGEKTFDSLRESITID